MAGSLRENGMGRTEILFLEDDGDERAGKQGKRRLTGILPKLQALFCVLAEGALAGGALYGRKLNAVILGLLVVVQIVLWSLLHWKSGKVLAKRRRVEYGREKSVLIGICFCGIVFVALAAVLFRPASYYDAVYRAEGYAEVMFRSLRGVKGLDSSGVISRGNQYRTGEVQLELAVSQEPTEPLYLRGFAGGEYVGNGWDAADEEAMFDEIARILDWEQWLGMIGGMYYSMYFVLNFDLDDGVSERTLYITHSDADYSNIYIPYYSRNRWFWRESGEPGEEGYECEYYEKNDMAVTWEGQTRLGEAKEWYRLLQGAYQEAMQEAYTQVPEELLPRLAALVDENPREGLEEVTAFIAYVLQDMASYTLTPGRPPVNEDIVEYFLFENGQGYCQHFAAAATLLYRLYGVPARYASGYVVQPSDFSFQDGIWRADVTDMSAHAWTEIFLEDYGWTPVEVTPTADGQLAISYPGLDSAVFRSLTDLERRSGMIGKSSGDRGADAEWDEGYSVLFDVGKHRDFWLVSGSCLVCFLLFVPVLLDYRRLRCRDKLGRADCREVYAGMMKLLHTAGYFPDMEGWESEFPRMAAEVFPEVTEAELRRQQGIIMSKVYGETLSKEEEAQYVRWVYFRMAEAVLCRMKRYRRLLFRYWKRY